MDDTFEGDISVCFANEEVDLLKKNRCNESLVLGDEGTDPKILSYSPASVSGTPFLPEKATIIPSFYEWTSSSMLPALSSDLGLEWVIEENDFKLSDQLGVESSGSSTFDSGSSYDSLDSCSDDDSDCFSSIVQSVVHPVFVDRPIHAVESVSASHKSEFGANVNLCAASNGAFEKYSMESNFNGHISSSEHNNGVAHIMSSSLDLRPQTLGSNGAFPLGAANNDGALSFDDCNEMAEIDDFSSGILDLFP